MPTQKTFDQFLIFVNLYQHAKNLLFHLFICRYINFTVPSPDWPHPVLTIPTFKIFLKLSNLHEFVPACKKHVKKQLIPSVHSSDKFNFRVQRENWPHLFLTMTNQKIVNQLLTFVNLH